MSNQQPPIRRSRFEDTLTDEQILQLSSELIELQRHPAWPLFQELLEGACGQARKAAFACSKDEFEHWQGFVRGIEEAQALVSAILTRAREMADEEDRQPTRRRRVPIEDPGDLTF